LRRIIQIRPKEETFSLERHHHILKLTWLSQREALEYTSQVLIGHCPTGKYQRRK
jgi:hypothetical protein